MNGVKKKDLVAVGALIILGICLWGAHIGTEFPR